MAVTVYTVYLPTVAGYHLPVEVLCEAQHPGLGVHVELALPVTVHYRVLDPTVLALTKRG